MLTRVKCTPRCDHCRPRVRCTSLSVLDTSCLRCPCKRKREVPPQGSLLQAKVRLVLRAGTIRTRVRSILSDVPSGWITASAGETHSTSRRHHLLLITPVRCRAATIDMSWTGAPAVLDDSPPAVCSSRRLTCARRKDHQTVAKLVRHPPNKNLPADVGELSNRRQLLLNPVLTWNSTVAEAGGE